MNLIPVNSQFLQVRTELSHLPFWERFICCCCSFFFLSFTASCSIIIDYGHHSCCCLNFWKFIKVKYFVLAQVLSFSSHNHILYEQTRRSIWHCLSYFSDISIALVIHPHCPVLVSSCEIRFGLLVGSRLRLGPFCLL